MIFLSLQSIFPCTSTSVKCFSPSLTHFTTSTCLPRRPLPLLLPLPSKPPAATPALTNRPGAPPGHRPLPPAHPGADAAPRPSRAGRALTAGSSVTRAGQRQPRPTAVRDPGTNRPNGEMPQGLPSAASLTHSHHGAAAALPRRPASSSHALPAANGVLPPAAGRAVPRVTALP